MKNILFVFLFVSVIGSSQNKMTNVKLDAIYSTISDSISGENSRWQFYINNVTLMSITDENNNRMRIISPIAYADKLSDTVLKECLTANFHTALDVKYAVSDNILWAVFIHPLKELSINQVKDAVSQVYYANVNFGTSYASTSLVFPGNEPEEEEKKEPRLHNKKI
jgi:hypothetical protein